jgi:hypothetical protein
MTPAHIEGGFGELRLAIGNPRRDSGLSRRLFHFHASSRVRPGYPDLDCSAIARFRAGRRLEYFHRDLDGWFWIEPGFHNVQPHDN